MGTFQKFLLLLGLLLRCQAVQRFSEVPEYTETNPGAAAVLRCRVAEKADASECVWQQNGLPVLPRSGKYEWAGQVDDGDCSLRVLRTNIAYDDGEWRCQVNISVTYTACATGVKFFKNSSAFDVIWCEKS